MTDPQTETAASQAKAAASPETPQTPPGAAANATGAAGGKPAGTCPPPQPNGRARGILTRLFDLLALFPLLPLTLIYAAQTAFTLDARSLWFSDEIRHGNVYETMLATGQWLVPHLNGIPYPDKPPVYFWFLGLLDAIPGVDGPMVFQLGAAVSGLLVLWTTYALARLVAGCDKRESFAAGLVLLCGLYFLGVTHYARMDLLFAAVITLAHICMYRGLRLPLAFRWIVPAFALAAVATLVKGPFGLAFPLLAGLAYGLWRGMPRRLNRMDVAIGGGIMLATLLAWVGAVWFEGYADLIRNILRHQIVDRATASWHHEQPWWHYLATLPAAWLPFTLVLPFLPWGRAFSPASMRKVLATRKGEGDGMAYIWLALITSFALLTAVSIKIVIYLLPLFPLLAVVTARALLRLNGFGSRMYFGLTALLLLVLALGLGAASLWQWAPDMVRVRFQPQALAMLDIVRGAPILAGVTLVFAVLLWKAVDRSRPEGGLLTLAAFVTALVVPAALLTAPSLDPIMSPRAQAELMGEYIRKGYHPVSYKVYSGTYTYYAGSNIEELSDEDSLRAAVAVFPQLVVAMRADRFAEWTDKPADLHEVHRQWIVDREYVLAERSAPVPPATPENPVTPTPDGDGAAPSVSGEQAPAPDAPALPQPAPGEGNGTDHTTPAAPAAPQPVQPLQPGRQPATPETPAVPLPGPQPQDNAPATPQPLPVPTPPPPPPGVGATDTPAAPAPATAQAQ
ncbi:ArnT family glycosyltransferase [Nitratidesulfovibrio termitidis]|uniref:ArnT family glycosyltransferase n=1 Tax=Nitratidesulfovibrio termitidis TaxID=42252 RepID=UPI0004159261|nr:dolichyl-phosphate-mannose--protein mannosyltransferase [Nitratidesulfovibrio termitidis]